jgi:hypothetical protein
MSSNSLKFLHGAMSNALLGQNSVVAPTGYAALAPAVYDFTNITAQSNGNLTPALDSNVRFNIDKNSMLVVDAVIETVMTPGTTVAGDETDPAAEYVRNAGDLIAQQTNVIYGTSTLQQFDGRFIAAWRTLCRKDIDIEDTNSLVLGGLGVGGILTGAPGGPAGPEPVLIDAYYNGVTLYSPLDELFFTKAFNQGLMPEAYALELQILVHLAPLADLVVTKSRTGADILVAPTVQSCRMRYTSIAISAAEKNNRLKLYRAPEGLVQHFWALETQRGLQFGGSGTRVVGSALSGQALIRSPRLLLGNYRMDIAEFIITVNRVRNTSPGSFPEEEGVEGGWGGSFLEDDSRTVSLLAPASGTSYATLVDIHDLQLYSGAKGIYIEDISGFWNRTRMRQIFHPRKGSASGTIFFISFARYPEDSINATGHLSAAVAGQLGLEVVVRNPGNTITYEVNTWAHTHNFMQSRGGGVAATYTA